MSKNDFAMVTKKAHELTKKMKENNSELDYKKTYSENFKKLKEELETKSKISVEEVKEKEVVKKEDNELKKTRKSSFKYGVKIILDDKVLEFENINICWSFLVEQGIKADIRKWFKTGIPKKHQRISLFEKIMN